jgi:D-alanyl-D-alanine carboxypeptidase/D-alanyl-D-alanine-endopeptidase (penicillin-binding protein 4)
VTSSPRPPHEREVAAIVSPPLSQLIEETNQESNNLYAESLLKTLGANPSRTADSSAAGLDVVKSSLTDLGVNPQSYVLTDGSGLSRHNLVSPEALVQTLRGMAQTPVAALYQASLPVAGVSGTLYKRFQKTPAQGILKAKTGSMSGVSTLAGYLNSPHFPPLVFSILVNQSDQSGKVLRQAIDEMVLLLTRLRSC